ncbi:MAG: DUF3108 domain-containing protein [Nitrosomonadales bacterium]|nr:DUF3108 domain-containing protein [Nitrosomonadales bacterium]
MIKSGVAASADLAASAVNKEDSPDTQQIFSDYARLAFAVHTGRDGFNIEEVHHLLEIKVAFDGAAQELRLSPGDESPRVDETRDALSHAYQLAQWYTHKEIMLPAIGRKHANDSLEADGEEEIATPLGKMRALHLHQVHIQGEAYFEIWLGLDRRSLPVRFRQIDGSGKVVEDIKISAIRIAGE